MINRQKSRRGMTQGNEERMSRLCLIKKKDWRLRNMNYI